MNAQSKSPFSRVLWKVVLAVAVVATLLVALSGVLFNLNDKIDVQSRSGGNTVRQKFSSLPAYEFYQAYGRYNMSDIAFAQPGALPVSSSSFLADGYTQATILNARAHNLSDLLDIAFVLEVALPVDSRSQPEIRCLQTLSEETAKVVSTSLPLGCKP